MLLSAIGKYQAVVFRVVAMCNVVVRYQHFIGSYCFHFEGEVSDTQKWT